MIVFVIDRPAEEYPVEYRMLMKFTLQNIPKDSIKYIEVKEKNINVEEEYLILNMSNIGKRIVECNIQGRSYLVIECIDEKYYLTTSGVMHNRESNIVTVREAIGLYKGIGKISINIDGGY